MTHYKMALRCRHVCQWGIQQLTCHQGFCKECLALAIMYHPAIWLQGCCLHHWRSLPSLVLTETPVALQRNVMPEFWLPSLGHAIKQTRATSKTKVDVT